MRVSLLIFVLWILGSIVTFYSFGTKLILPYAGVTIVLFALAVWLANKKPKPPTTLNSFALPMLFLLNFNLSGWWLFVLLLVAVWIWALTRKSSGDYDFGPGMAIVAALLITVACLVGAGFGWAMA
jgi:hypothetical protein